MCLYYSYLTSQSRAQSRICLVPRRRCQEARSLMGRGRIPQLHEDRLNVPATQWVPRLKREQRLGRTRKFKKHLACEAFLKLVSSVFSAFKNGEEISRSRDLKITQLRAYRHFEPIKIPNLFGDT